MFRTLLACLLCVVGVGALWAESEVETPLAAVPADALFVARLARPEVTFERAHAFTRAAEILPKRSGDPFAAVGNWIGNPRLSGVDRSTDWWFAGLVDEKGRSHTLFLIPTSSYVQTRRALEKTFGRTRIHRTGEWVVYSTDEGVVEQSRNTTEGKGESLDDVLEEAERALLLDGEATIRFAPAALDHVPIPDDFTLPLPGELLEKLDFELGTADDLKALLGVVRENVQSLVLSVRVSPGRIGLETLVRLPTDRLGELVSNDGPAREPWLTRLPEDQLVYLGVQGVPSSTVRATLDRVGEDLPRRSELRRRLVRTVEALESITIGQLAASFGLGRVEGGAMRVTKVVAAGPEEKVRDLLRREYGETSFDAFETAQQVRVEPEGATIAGRRADRLRVSVRREGRGRAWVDALYGKDGLEGHLLVERGRVVQVLGGGREFAEDCVRRLDDRTGRVGNSVLQASLDRLPENANVVVLSDLPSLVVGVLRAGLRGGAIEKGLDPRVVDEFDRDRNYVGASLGLEPEGLRAAVHVPATQIRRSRSVLEFLATRVGLGGS